MTFKTNSFAAQVSGAAMLALAALPIAALATAAHAETVKVADLNLLTPAGVSAFEARAEKAARTYCTGERGVIAVESCRAAVRSELADKMAVVREAQLRASQNFAAR